MSDGFVPAKQRIRRVRKSPRQKGIPRKKTVPTKNLTRAVMAAGWVEIGGDDELPQRPRTRAECPTSRPCGWVGCRHHNYLSVNPETGAITFDRPDLEPHQLMNSCSLDVADGGPRSLEEVGEIMNITRERVRQIELEAIVRKLKNTARVNALGIEAKLG